MDVLVDNKFRSGFLRAVDGVIDWSPLAIAVDMLMILLVMIYPGPPEWLWIDEVVGNALSDA